jgi:hypothetical protein
LPIADCRLPIADCRLPIADCRLPIADCRLPIWNILSKKSKILLTVNILPFSVVIVNELRASASLTLYSIESTKK